MGYTLYGQDVDENTTPLEANLEKFVSLDKDFIGRDVLLRQKKEGVKRLLIGFKTTSRRAPRHGYSIMKDGKEIGKVTSGGFSPSLSCGIGLGCVMMPYAKAGEGILIKNGQIEIEATITNRPFYKNTTLKN